MLKLCNVCVTGPTTMVHLLHNRQLCALYATPSRSTSNCLSYLHDTKSPYTLYDVLSLSARKDSRHLYPAHNTLPWDPHTHVAL